MNVDDYLSIVKFHGLVDKCRDKKEILDLCEKALQKYRPEVFEIKKNVLYGDLKIHSISSLPNTEIIRSRIALDDYTRKLQGNDVSNYYHDTICRNISREMVKQNHIKVTKNYDAYRQELVYEGQLEIVKR